MKIAATVLRIEKCSSGENTILSEWGVSCRRLTKIWVLRSCEHFIYR